MNFTDFINTYSGKRVEYDNVSYYQCVDLVKMYANKVLGLRFGAFGNAKDYYYNYNNIALLKDNFKKIPNTATFIPQRGDIVVWKNGSYGHIAVATGEGTTSWFKSFDQNYGLNKKCRIVKHNYKNFLGVLRPYNQDAIYGSKYHLGQAVEISVPVAIANYNGGEKSLVDDGKEQFWVENSVIENGKIHARVNIAHISGKRYLVQCLSSQFWVDEKNIVKALK